MPSVVGTMRLVAGVQNMCQRVSTAARHFFLTRDFYTIYAIFTQFYVIFAQFYMIFTQFYRHKFSAARHLKLFFTPAKLGPYQKVPIASGHSAYHGHSGDILFWDREGGGILHRLQVKTQPMHSCQW